MKTRFLLPALVLGLAALLVWISFFWEPVAPKDGFRAGTAPDASLARMAPAPTGGDFTLQTASGPLSLQDYRGKVVVLYLGYTFCPDVCPTSLALLAQGLSSLDESELARVQGLFVSVDPERDTPERLQEYAPFFHPAIVGASGTPEVLAALAQRYGASYTRQASNADGQYAVDHSSITYVIGPEGKLLHSLPHATPPQQIAEAIRAALPVRTTP